MVRFGPAVSSEKMSRKIGTRLLEIYEQCPYQKTATRNTANLQQRAQAEPVSTPSHISTAKINPVEEPEDARPCNNTAHSTHS
jgi:adenylylsulfate kinase-like enzyme